MMSLVCMFGSVTWTDEEIVTPVPTQELLKCCDGVDLNVSGSTSEKCVCLLAALAAPAVLCCVKPNLVELHN